MDTEITLSPNAQLTPAPLFAPTAKAAKRFVEFFTAQIHNDNTRKAYLNATRRFSGWCEEHSIARLEDVEAFHVAAFLKDISKDLAAPSVKQHLAALRMLFDWLVTGQVLPINPAHSVRGPKHSVKRGKTTVLMPEEARALLESIPTTLMTGGIVGLRDRALIGTMIYTFARINAVLRLRVEDYFVQGRRGWLRLSEKGGKEYAVPCHHKLEEYLDEYLTAVGRQAKDAALFRSIDKLTGALSRRPLAQQDVYRMIQRRASRAGLESKVCNHTFRATGITAYLKNGGKLEVAQVMAGHESPRTTKLYDRRDDEISLDEVERILI